MLMFPASDAAPDRPHLAVRPTSSLPSDAPDLPVSTSDDSQRDRCSTADAIVSGSLSQYLRKLPARQLNQWLRDSPSSGSSLKLKSRCRCIVASSPRTRQWMRRAGSASQRVSSSAVDAAWPSSSEVGGQRRCYALVRCRRYVPPAMLLARAGNGGGASLRHWQDMAYSFLMRPSSWALLGARRTRPHQRGCAVDCQQ
ncbi:uncharacterized protein SCHCODRAFT_02070989 [Schizophyllum commune H4-8]|uniref:uncharacterized protein n=1 Tax=Schizophyllum commune (strain H4-8 / FGSC 9210) TaxID=578458 RepID=UPI002160C140|nr:uncharacterized protein SCHCODRAFT_02070989 [Schizophyllum commune H4-8]KAI5887712.1 hypothetical protein SCHCODRAFT_02070989 [Schizophyllum commune H4-8]